MIRFNGVTFDTVKELIEYQRAVREGSSKPEKSEKAFVPRRQNVPQEALLNKCRQVFAERSNRISIERLANKVYGRDVSEPTLNKFKELVLDNFDKDKIRLPHKERRKAPHKVHYMGVRRKGPYLQFLSASIKKIMIEQKLDYFAASRIAQAEWSKLKNGVQAKHQPASAKPYIQMPVILPLRNELLRMVVKDLVRGHITKISDDYADQLMIPAKDWDSFMIKFLQQSKNVAAHLDVPNKFKLEEGSIKYG